MVSLATPTLSWGQMYSRRLPQLAIASLYCPYSTKLAENRFKMDSDWKRFSDRFWRFSPLAWCMALHSEWVLTLISPGRFRKTYPDGASCGDTIAITKRPVATLRDYSFLSPASIRASWLASMAFAFAAWSSSLTVTNKIAPPIPICVAIQPDSSRDNSFSLA